MASFTKECWIVRTGTTYATITLALAAVAAKDTVLLSDGEFLEDVSLTQNDITIVGQGRGRSIMAGRVYNNGKSNLRLRDLTIEHSSTIVGLSVTAPGVQLFNVDIKLYNTATTIGISIGAASTGDVFLENVFIEGGDYGLVIDANAADIDNISLKNVTFLNQGRSAITVTNSSSYAITGVKMTDVNVYGFGQVAAASGGIWLRGGVIRMKRVQVSGGVQAGDAGLLLDNVQAYYDINLEADDCVFRDNAEYGISILTGSGTLTQKIRNCSIYGNGVKDAIADSGTVDLEYNWWGVNPPVAGQFTNIDYTPWLTQPIGVIHNTELIATTESNIRGADSDDLKDISDQLDNIEPEVSVHIETPNIEIPDGQSTLNGAITAIATSLILADSSLLPEKGYLKIESEWLFYGAKSGNTLSSIVRGLFGTSGATHADATAIYQGIPKSVIMTIHDAGVPLAPSSVPTIAIEDMEGNAILAATSMTQEGAKVGIYYYNLLYDSSQAYPDVWVIKFVVVALSGKTNEFRKIISVLGEAATQSDVENNTVGSDLRILTEDGYWDSTGTLVTWTDDYVGDWEDSEGNLVFQGIVTVFHYLSGSTTRQKNPPGRTKSDINGEWAMLLPPGTYTFNFWKDGVTNVEVQRTVT